MAHDPTADRQAKEVAYPLLDPAQVAALSEALERVVVMRQARPLAKGQLKELRSVIAAQIADAERLHAFPLTNADEPAYVMPGHAGWLDEG